MFVGDDYQVYYSLYINVDFLVVRLIVLTPPPCWIYKVHLMNSSDKLQEFALIDGEILNLSDIKSRNQGHCREKKVMLYPDFDWKIPSHCNCSRA